MDDGASLAPSRSSTEAHSRHGWRYLIRSNMLRHKCSILDRPSPLGKVSVVSKALRRLTRARKKPSMSPISRNRRDIRKLSHSAVHFDAHAPGAASIVSLDRRSSRTPAAPEAWFERGRVEDVILPERERPVVPPHHDERMIPPTKPAPSSSRDKSLPPTPKEVNAASRTTSLNPPRRSGTKLSVHAKLQDMVQRSTWGDTPPASAHPSRLISPTARMHAYEKELEEAQRRIRSVSPASVRAPSLRRSPQPKQSPQERVPSPEYNLDQAIPSAGLHMSEASFLKRDPWNLSLSTMQPTPIFDRPIPISTEETTPDSSPKRAGSPKARRPPTPAFVSEGGIRESAGPVERSRWSPDTPHVSMLAPEAQRPATPQSESIRGLPSSLDSEVPCKPRAKPRATSAPITLVQKEWPSPASSMYAVFEGGDGVPGSTPRLGMRVETAKTDAMPRDVSTKTRCRSENRSSSTLASPVEAQELPQPQPPSVASMECLVTPRSSLGEAALMPPIAHQPVAFKLSQVPYGLQDALRDVQHRAEKGLIRVVDSARSHNASECAFRQSALQVIAEVVRDTRRGLYKFGDVEIVVNDPAVRADTASYTDGAMLMRSACQEFLKRVTDESAALSCDRKWLDRQRERIYRYRMQILHATRAILVHLVRQRSKDMEEKRVAYKRQKSQCKAEIHALRVEYERLKMRRYECSRAAEAALALRDTQW